MKGDRDRHCGGLQAEVHAGSALGSGSEALSAGSGVTGETGQVDGTDSDLIRRPFEEPRV